MLWSFLLPFLTLLSLVIMTIILISITRSQEALANQHPIPGSDKSLTAYAYTKLVVYKDQLNRLLTHSHARELQHGKHQQSSNSPCRAQDRGNRALHWHGLFLAVSQATILTQGHPRETLHRRAIHGVPHFSSWLTSQPTLLQLYSSLSNLCDFGQVQAQVEGHWPDLFLVTSSPALRSAGDKITPGDCSLSLSVTLQMLLAYPSYLYHLPYSRQETDLYPPS